MSKVDETECRVSIDGPGNEQHDRPMTLAVRSIAKPANGQCHPCIDNGRNADDQPIQFNAAHRFCGCGR